MDFWVLPFQDETATLLWGIYLGVILAGIYWIFTEKAQGKLFCILLEKVCGEENAASPEALGIPEKRLVRLAGKHPGTVIVKDGKVFLSDSEEKVKRAQFLARRKGNGVLPLVLTVAGGYFVLCIAYYLLPVLAQAL